MDISKFFCILHKYSTAKNTITAGQAGMVCESNHISGRKQKPAGNREEVLTDIFCWNPFPLGDGGCQEITCKEQGLLKQLLKLFSTIPDDSNGDLLGKIYEFFLGKFGLDEAQKGGEFFTPTSVGNLMVEYIEPYHGKRKGINEFLPVPDIQDSLSQCKPWLYEYLIGDIASETNIILHPSGF